MEPIAQIRRPSVLMRTFFKIGERMFGQVPTPERLMARIGHHSCSGSAASTAPSSGSGRSTASFARCSTCRSPRSIARRIEWTSVTPSA
jgi:hypothetical protein